MKILLMKKVSYCIPAAVICLYGLVSCSFGHGPEKDSMPNIIIIYADDLGYGDLSSYGGDIPTPNIDRLGEEGIRFTDFYVSAPACTPSRYSLLTGAYPQRSKHGLTSALMPADTNYLDTSEKILPAYLKARGYTTAIIGKWHLGFADSSGMPFLHGFDQFSGFRGGCIDFFDHVYSQLGHDWYVSGKPVQEPGYSTDLITGHAIDFIESVNEKPTPFFLYLPYNAPHYGKTDPGNIPENTVSLKEGMYRGTPVINSLQAPASYLERFNHIDDPYRRAYSAMVSCLDDNIGSLLGKLEEQHLLDNTMIWFISDNGGYSESYYGHADNDGLRGEKGTLWEGGIRVPALLRWEGHVPEGRVEDSPVCNLDILPTLASILGFEDELLEEFTDGVDISPLLLRQPEHEGRESAANDAEAFPEGALSGEAPQAEASTGSVSFVEARTLFWRYRKQTALRKGDWKLVNGEELYNLASDRNESKNLAPEHPEKVRELQELFIQINQTF